MASANRNSTTERDLRLDFFRGLALFCIFIDHLPNNILASFTFQSVMFSDAAEVFVLISGYTAGMVYGRILERQGFLKAAQRIYHRICQLYIAHIFLFLVYTAIVVYTVSVLNNGLYADEFGAASFLNEPGVALAHALLLQFQPAFMNILPLYIVLLAVLPIVLFGFRSWAGLVLITALSLWLWVQFDSRIALSTYPDPDGVWFFNPLAWQALFLLGAWFGWRNIRGGILPPERRWLLWSAVGLSVVGFMVRFSWTLHGFYDPIPVPIDLNLLWAWLSKSDLGLLRFANVLAGALLVFRLIDPGARFFSTRLAWPFVVCGRNSLHVFCLGILLSLVANLLLGEFFGSIAIQLGASAAGIVIMVLAAGMLELLREYRTSGRSAVRATTVSRGAQP